MTIKVGLNGFGRIGRNFLRAALKNEKFFDKFEVVAINDLGSPKMLAYLFKYDSVFGRLPYKVEVKDNKLIVEGHEMLILNEASPDKLPWKDLGVDIAMEATGRFTDRDKAALHLKAGAQESCRNRPPRKAQTSQS
jgi:glyceraldehyde-3-phosphate dehydrogenase/erythrose-4-phosphate dehydrogenase